MTEPSKPPSRSLAAQDSATLPTTANTTGDDPLAYCDGKPDCGWCAEYGMRYCDRKRELIGRG